MRDLGGRARPERDKAELKAKTPGRKTLGEHEGAESESEAKDAKADGASRPSSLFKGVPWGREDEEREEEEQQVEEKSDEAKSDSDADDGDDGGIDDGDDDGGGDDGDEQDEDESDEGAQSTKADDAKDGKVDAKGAATDAKGPDEAKADGKGESGELAGVDASSASKTDREESEREEAEGAEGEITARAEQDGGTVHDGADDPEHAEEREEESEEKAGEMHAQAPDAHGARGTDEHEAHESEAHEAESGEHGAMHANGEHANGEHGEMHANGEHGEMHANGEHGELHEQEAGEAEHEQRLGEGEEYGETDAQRDEELQPSGEGHRLDARIRARLEQETGYALEGIRIHTDGNTSRKLREHGALGVAKGRNILLADSGRVNDYELIRHEVNHVIQQANGKVSPKLAANERAKHEDDADRTSHRAHHELKDLGAPSTGPAQFKYGDPVGPQRSSQPKPKPKPAPTPRLSPAVINRRVNGPSAPPVRRAPRPAPSAPAPRLSPAVINRRTGNAPAPRPAKPAKPKPYVLRTTGDTHWHDSNLRGQSVNTKVQRWKQKHSHQQALLNARAQKTGGDPRVLMPNLTKREKQDLKAYRRSTRIAQDGQLFARGVRLKREAEERKRAEAERKKKEGGGFWGGLKKVAKGAGKVVVKATHVGLDVASYVPGPVGSGASAANAGIYFAEGNEKKGKEKLIEAAAGLIPVPGSKLAGKLVLKAAQKGAAEIAVKKAAGKTGKQVIAAARRGRKMIKHNKKAIERGGRELYEDAVRDQGKAAAKSKANGEEYDPFKTAAQTLVGTGNKKLVKKLLPKPKDAANKLKYLTKKKIVLLPVPKSMHGAAMKAAEKAGGNLEAPANKVANDVTSAIQGDGDEKKKG